MFVVLGLKEYTSESPFMFRFEECVDLNTKEEVCAYILDKYRFVCIDKITRDGVTVYQRGAAQTTLP
jgi:hypothetical protein